MRKFNVTGLCVPEDDYMVDISDKLEQVIKLIDNRSYFTINRARQYGKTTTLACLENRLRDSYLVASISFEGLSNKSFESPEAFCPMFLRRISKALKFSLAPDQYIEEWINNSITDFDLLSEHITKMCENAKVVLMIDEVDKISNNQIFLYFLGMLREKFLLRKNKKDHTFHSVILVGVYDIKNIKLKMINEGTFATAAEESKIYNSPWNIAVDFDIDMSFSALEISSMLTEYEADHNIGMDIGVVSEEISRFTGGYPYLVSKICQTVDRKLDKDWTPGGVKNAVKIIINEQNTLFDDLFKNLENNKNLYDFIYDILISGKEKSFKISNPLVNLGYMYGFFVNKDGKVAIANRIFETLIYEHFISKDESENKNQITGVLQQDVVKNGQFDMELCLRKFAAHFAEIFSERDLRFIETHGRLLFLSYLKPLINGQGFFHIESQSRDLRRMDIVVDFGRDQFIIELKIWYGNSKHQAAYEQLLGYMDSKRASTGYLLTFDFRKDANKQRCAQWVEFDNRRIFDVVI
ncbi:MAG: ATP-binding protein [Clostridiales bacterium]|nr:ATP-binding protein [Clostridiales bacterium]